MERLPFDEDGWYDAVEDYPEIALYSEFIEMAIEPHYRKVGTIYAVANQYRWGVSETVLEKVVTMALEGLRQGETVVIMENLNPGVSDSHLWRIKVLDLRQGTNDRELIQMTTVRFNDWEINYAVKTIVWDSSMTLRSLYATDPNAKYLTYPEGTADFLKDLGFTKKVVLTERNHKMIQENGIHAPEHDLEFWVKDDGPPTIYQPSNTRYPKWLMKAFKDAKV